MDHSFAVTNGRKFTKVEEQMIWRKPASHKTSQEEVRIASEIKNNWLDPEMKIMNVLLEGDAGSGKTQLVRALSDDLQLPYTKVTCFADMDKTDVFGALLPVVSTDSDEDQLSHNRIIRSLAKAYVAFFRNIPLLIIVMFFYVVAPMYFYSFDGFQAGTIGLTIYTSAFIAETVRSGIQTVPKGQMEAGLSSGFSYSETMRYIVLPQAFKIVVPPLGNQFLFFR